MLEKLDAFLDPTLEQKAPSKKSEGKKSDFLELKDTLKDELLAVEDFFTAALFEQMDFSERRKELIEKLPKFSLAALVMPKKLISELFDVIHGELEKPKDPPEKNLQAIFFKQDPSDPTKFVLNPTGEFFLKILKNPDYKEKLVILLEVNFLTLLVKVSTETASPEKFLDTVNGFLSLFISKQYLEETSLLDLLKQFLQKNEQLSFPLISSKESTLEVTNFLSQWLEKGVLSLFRKLEEILLEDQPALRKLKQLKIDFRDIFILSTSKISKCS